MPQSKPDHSISLLKVAWFSILLGLFLEIVLVISASFFGKSAEVKSILADLVQKISWSSIVCVGLAIGAVVSKKKAVWMGLAGLAAAPAAFHLARVLHKSANQALAVAGSPGSAPSPMVLALIKAGEYAVFGVVFSRLMRNEKSELFSYAVSGFVIALFFGGGIIWLTIIQNQPSLPPAAITARMINEFIFPVGCAIVLFSAEKLGSKKD